LPIEPRRCDVTKQEHLARAVEFLSRPGIGALGCPFKVSLSPLKRIRRINPDADSGVCEIFLNSKKTRPTRVHLHILDTANVELTIRDLFHEWSHALRAHMPGFGDLNDDDPTRAVIEDQLWRRWHESQ
jgi:hypothetical protein